MYEAGSSERLYFPIQVRAVGDAARIATCV